MAKTKEIRDGLFSISWAVGLDSFLSSRQNCQASQVEVENLQDFLKSCSLACKLEKEFIILELKTADPPASLRGVVVSANYDGVKHKMTLNGSTWKASWNWTSLAQCDDCKQQPVNHNQDYYGRQPVTFNPVYQQNCCQCSRKLTRFLGFDILIDLKPDCVVSVKKGSKHVLEHLAKLWENKTLSDVTFNCGEKLIKAHTLILASGSPVLAAMFQNDFKENRERMVVIKEFESIVFENFLRYIYVGECDLLQKGGGRNDVANLFVAADKYAVDSLKEECEIHLSQILAVENVAQYLVLAHLHNGHKLRKTALDFMSKNAKAVCSRKDWMKIIKTHPELCFQATQLMVGL